MMEKAAPIQFHYQADPFSFPNRTSCKQFLVQLFRREKKALAQLTYVFCTDAYLLTINQDFLQHDYFTDIITFGLSEPKAPIEGEVYISIDRVRDNAQNLGESFQRELHRVIFHGALHLCGYKDKTKAEEKLMRQKEEEYLERYFK